MACKFKCISTGGATISTPGDWVGTTVPNSGTLSEVYFNTALSVEEVGAKLKELTHVYIGLNANILMVPTDASMLLIVYFINRTDGYFAIENRANGIVYFNSDPDYCTFIGWNPTIFTDTNKVVFDNEKTLITESDGIVIGAENDLISSLFSTTPFEQETGEPIILEGAYDGSTLVVDEVPKSGLTGTTVPNSGTLSEVYVNTALTEAEILEIHSKVENPIEQNGMKMSTILSNTNGSSAIIMGVSSDNTLIQIMVSDNGSRQIMYATGSGWDTSIITDGKYTFSQEVTLVNSVNGYDVGVDNDKLSSLFSITPFSQGSGLFDMRPYIVDEKKIPLDLDIKLQEKSITENGEVVADNGYYGLSKVNVSVEPSLQEKSITENGEVVADNGYYGLSKVNVNVPIPEGYIMPEGSLEITENGTHNVTNYASAVVNVASSGGVGGATISTPGDWVGTTVPNSGTLSEVYFNTALTETEILEMSSKLENPMEHDGAKISYILANFSGKSVIGLIVASDNSSVQITVVDNGSNQLMYETGSGWNTSIITDGKYTFSQEVTLVSSVAGINMGMENDKLSSLFSITPIVQSEGEQIILEGDYDGSTLEVGVESNTVDIKSMIETERKIPLDIEIHHPLQEKSITENGEVVADEGYYGLSKVNVNVPIPEGYIMPSGTLDITYNGSFNVREYENVNVDTDSGNETTLKKLLDYTKSTYHMFYQNTTITDLTGYIAFNDTSNVTDTTYMFGSCSNLTTLPLFDMSSVILMSNMFYGCSSLVEIPLFDTSEVTSMSGAFSGCSALKTIQELNTSKVDNANSLFKGCNALTEIPPLNTNLNGTQVNMFDGCYNLLKVDLSSAHFVSESYSNRMCYNCYSLKQLIIRSFHGYKYLLHSSAFTNCYHLTGTINATYNPNGDQDCYIYVPSAMVDTLKSETTWSLYGDQIRALEDYTVDGTTTGELDETKI